MKQPIIHKFAPTIPTGPTIAIPDSPLEIFQQLYTPDLFDYLTYQTNKYTKEILSPEQYSKFEGITRKDIEAYMGFCILVGINSLPSLKVYWKRDSIHDYTPIADCISRKRFEDITRYLHFADNSSLSPPGPTTYDRLGKVRPLMDRLQKKFAEIYIPGENVSVDEAMIKFQGRSSLKRYMPMKPTKRGIKVWLLADEYGYFSRLEVYTDKKDDVEHSLGARVVKNLTQDFQGCWRHVIFDSFFTSRQLLCDLESSGIYGCGTARKDKRGFPVELKKLNIKTR